MLSSYIRMPRKLLVFFIACLLCSTAYSQFRFYPLQGNAVIKQFVAAHPGYTWNKPGYLSKTSFQDTLDLPFFEDFSQSFLYPDSSRWQDNDVFVNYDLAVNPPSIGVATFDNLNSQGNPYFGLNDQVTSKSDTLTSQYINLELYYVSSIPVEYLPGDSVILSFFYQAQGRSSDKLDPTDSLVLEFRRSDGNWRRVWRTPGISLGSFQQGFVKIEDTAYLHGAFQFRFINYAKNTGFSNLWHLDYIRMDRNRSVLHLEVKDVAISEKPTSLLRNYYSMPWNQYIANAAGEKAQKHSYRVRNNDTAVANVSFQFSAYNKYGTLLQKDLFVNNNSNIEIQSDTIYYFNNFNFDTLGEPVVIRKEYQILNFANNQEALNDQFTINQVFDNYIAYDDGTAEDGMGLDYGSLPSNSTGKVAIRFRLNTQDTLRGIQVFFNQSQVDVSVKNLSMMVWQSVDQNGGPAETLIREIPMSHAVYTDSLNGFYLLRMDTLIVLPAGEFFIGWKQTSKFILNIGLDRNYRVNGADAINPNLFYNILGIWEQGELRGAPMIRPVLGRELPVTTGIKKVKEVAGDVVVYPNPAADVLHITAPERFSDYSVMDLTGKQLMSGELHGNYIGLEGLACGMYILKLTGRQGETATAKFIVNP